MTQNRLAMTFLFCPCYDIIIWAGHISPKYETHSPPAFIPQTPFCGREISLGFAKSFPQKIVLAKPSPPNWH